MESNKRTVYLVRLCAQSIPIHVRSHQVQTASRLHGRLIASNAGQERATFTCGVSLLLTARAFEIILYCHRTCPINPGPRVTSVIWQKMLKIVCFQFQVLGLRTQGGPLRRCTTCTSTVKFVVMLPRRHDGERGSFDSRAGENGTRVTGTT
jgi:hypothetical protein